MKKVCLLAMVMLLFFIPAASGSAAGSVYMNDNSIRVTSGFDDRSSGTLSIMLENKSATDIIVNVSVEGNYPHPDRVYALRENITVPYDRLLDVAMSFHIGTPGTYWVKVIVTDASSGEILSERNNIQIDVGQSIWSNTWTYIAIIIVIIIIAIGAYIKIRGNPKVEESGAFTAMEEERKAGKKGSGTKREEYKGRPRK
ncbi:MAG: hypothetical protein FWD92_02645 [Methanomassiliicoccaceae archaeon]|nr:hypothetical protein [Methanomassiliicoccaceae archaeon]